MFGICFYWLCNYVKFVDGLDYFDGDCYWYIFVFDIGGCF